MKYKKIVLLAAFISFALTCPAQTGMVDTKGTIEDRFPKKIGGMRFSETTLHIGSVLNNETRTDSIHIYNNSVGAITLSTSSKIPNHLKLEFKPLKLEPGSEGLLIVSYAAALRNEFGFVFDRIILQTNDAVQPEKNINITATIKEYFPVSDPADTLLIQKAIVAESAFNFGRIQQGEKAHHDFVIFNGGQHNLIVHHAKSNCGCIRTSFSKNTVAPGDSAIVTVEFDSFGKVGAISNEVLVFISDPAKPEIRFTIQGDVWK